VTLRKDGASSSASLSRINQDVAAEPKWDKEAIVRRAQRLAELAIKIWPAPGVAKIAAAPELSA
jgi:hypothetical protein